MVLFKNILISIAQYTIVTKICWENYNDFNVK